VGAPAPVRGVWSHRVLRRFADAARVRALADCGHPIIQSFEPGEDWFWDFESADYYDGPELAPPNSRPADQTVPGPKGRVPRDWYEQLQQRRD